MTATGPTRKGISIPALREEGDIPDGHGCAGADGFLSPPSARRATIEGVRMRHEIQISIPALREEGDPCRGTAGTSPADFYPRPPRGGRLDDPLKVTSITVISIPALREEGDLRLGGVKASFLTFLSPPSARRATPNPATSFSTGRFLSPPSARRATIVHVVAQRVQNISIPALREEGDPNCPLDGFRQLISIPALREEGDSRRSLISGNACYFYPRPPRGGRRFTASSLSPVSAISIPALREEGDWKGEFPLNTDHDFYPRPPRGGRPSSLIVNSPS